MLFATCQKLVQMCTNFSRSGYTHSVRWLVFISTYRWNVREHTAKVKGYGRKAALFSYQQYLKPHSSAGCNCFNKTQGKRVAQDQSCAN